MGFRKKIGISFLAAVLAFQATGSTSNALENGKPVALEDVTDRVIVTMKKREDRYRLGAAITEALEVPGPADLISLEVPEHYSLDEYIQELEEMPDVANVEPDYLYETTGRPNDPYYSVQYHHTTLNSEKAWGRTLGSPDVIVAILDDGFDLDHPDLKNQILFSYSTASATSEDDHGTHVAGIVGASMNNSADGTGIAPNTALMPIDVFEGELAYNSDIIEGIYAATQFGADIINMSLGNYTFSTVFNDAIQYAHRNGVVVIAAAGNDASAKAHYPSGYTNVISVGSTDRDNRISTFSNYGNDQDIVAPGRGIYSTLKNGSFGSMSGTSMASPVVAGVAALVKANEPNLTNTEIAERLYATAKDLGSPGKDVVYGNGLVDAGAALMIMDIPQPTLSNVYDYSTEVSGNLNQAVTDGKIIVSNEEGEIGKLINYNGYNFAVSIPKQSADARLSITITDRYGNTSQTKNIQVMDGTAPEAPIVNQVTDKSTSISGTAEAASIVRVKVAASEIGSVQASADGKFALSITKQKAGTNLTVTAADKANNVSPTATLTVKDATAPSAPIINNVTDEATSISGTAEAGSTVIVNAGAEEVVQGTTAATGNFTVAIDPQTVGTELSIVAVDAAGNKSAATKTTVVKAGPEVTDRISGASRYLTAIAISKAGWNSADTVVLATAANFPDALAGGPLAFQENAPILLTAAKTLTPETKQEIVRLGASKVIILGSAGAVSAEVEAELVRMDLTIQRIGGQSRFDTAALIAKELNSDQAIIANGLNFPDVLSVSSYAARKGIPILLTRTDRLPEETKAALTNTTSTYVIGSAGAVSEEVYKTLPNPTRLGGKDRYETGYIVATTLSLGTKKAYIATGMNFPDALAGSVLAAKNDAPILLVRPEKIPEPTYKQLGAYDDFSIFGGTGAVSDNVKSLLDEALRNK